MDIITRLLMRIDPLYVKIAIGVLVAIIIFSLIKKAVKVAIVTIIVTAVISVALPFVNNIQEKYNISVEGTVLSITIDGEEYEIDGKSVTGNLRIEEVDTPDGKVTYIVVPCKSNDLKIEVPGIMKKPALSLIQKQIDELAEKK